MSPNPQSQPGLLCAPSFFFKIFLARTLLAPACLSFCQTDQDVFNVVNGEFFGIFSLKIFEKMFWKFWTLRVSKYNIRFMISVSEPKIPFWRPAARPRALGSSNRKNFAGMTPQNQEKSVRAIWKISKCSPIVSFYRNRKNNYGTHKTGFGLIKNDGTHKL